VTAQQTFAQRTHFQMREQLEAERSKREDDAQRFRDEVTRRIRKELFDERQKKEQFGFMLGPCPETYNERVKRVCADVRRDWGLQ
jgi:hypothetical protein